MELSQLVLKKFIGLKPSPVWSFSEFQRSETNKLSHSYHRYPAKFIPQLVDKLISENTKEGDYVCDPFGGCGTTLVESKIGGRVSIGFDINPVAKFITDTKTRAIHPTLLIEARQLFVNKLKSSNKRNKKINHHQKINYWFDKKTILKLDKIYSSINFIKDKNIRRFFLCAFSHVLKNCSRWLMKSIKPTIDQNKKFPNPTVIFLKHLDSMIKKNNSFYINLKESGRLNIPAKMKLWNSTEKLPIKNKSIDLIVTSPPYVTSYEYADLHQLSLLWFGDDKKNFKNWDIFIHKFFDFRKQFIGSSFKTADNLNFESKIAEKIVINLKKKDSGLSRGVASYFLDMKKAFYEMYRILKPGKKACVIIGNTELKGVEILNAEVATEQMLNIGFKNISLVKREISNKMITPWRDGKTGKFTGKSNQNKKRAYRYEYVLIMKK